MGCYTLGVVRFCICVLREIGMGWEGKRRLTINNIKKAGERDSFSFLFFRELVRFFQCLSQVHNNQLIAYWII